MLIAIIIIVVLIILIIPLIVPTLIYMILKLKKVKISFFYCIQMFRRKTCDESVIDAIIFVKENNLDISIEELEAIYLAKGDPLQLAKDTLYAQKQNVPLPFKTGAAIQLAKKDIRKAIDQAKNAFEIKTYDHDIYDANGYRRNYIYNCKLKLSISNIVKGRTSSELIARSAEEEIAEQIEKSTTTDIIKLESDIAQNLKEEFWPSKGVEVVSHHLRFTYQH